MKNLFLYLIVVSFFSSCTKPPIAYPYKYLPDYGNLEEISRTYIYSNSSFNEVDLNQEIVDDNLQSLKTIIKGEDPVVKPPEVFFERQSEETLVFSSTFGNDTMSFEVAYPFKFGAGAGISYNQDSDGFTIYYHVVFEPQGFPTIETYVIDDHESYLNAEWGPKFSEGDEITYIGLYVSYKAED